MGKFVNDHWVVEPTFQPSLICCYITHPIMDSWMVFLVAIMAIGGKAAPNSNGTYNPTGFTSKTPCGNNVNNPGRPICSGAGLCMRIAEASPGSHVRIECWKTKSGLGDIEWVSADSHFRSNREKLHYLNFNSDSRQQGRCMYMDWGAVREGRGIQGGQSFVVTCRVRSPSWTEVTGTVNSAINTFN